MQPEANQNILIIEDDRDFAYRIKSTLKSRGMKVKVKVDGRDGLKELLTGKYNIALVDLGLPKVDGISILEIAKDSGVDIPIILLSDINKELDEIVSYRYGADLFNFKPVDPELIFYQIRSLIRKVQLKDKVKLGSWMLDIKTRSLIIQEESIRLTKSEFKFLRKLMNSPKEVFSKEEIYEFTYSKARGAKPNAIDTMISRLRKKLPDDSLIETVYGFGYRINQELV